MHNMLLFLDLNQVNCITKSFGMFIVLYVVCTLGNMQDICLPFNKFFMLYKVEI